jgi:hypothetical protein
VLLVGTNPLLHPLLSPTPNSTCTAFSCESHFIFIPLMSTSNVLGAETPVYVLLEQHPRFPLCPSCPILPFSPANDVSLLHTHPIP